jgi:phage baseplate assembly protein W
MAMDPEQLGSDLHLLDQLIRGDDRTTRGDLHIHPRLVSGNSILMDLEPISGVGNLEQALLMRLLTPRGALEGLGHPEYGSRLQTLIGELNSETNRNRAKLYVLEALAQEPRIGEVLSVNVNTSRSTDPTRIDITVLALVANSKEVVNLVFPFFLQ